MQPLHAHRTHLLRTAGLAGVLALALPGPGRSQGFIPGPVAGRTVIELIEPGRAPLDGPVNSIVRAPNGTVIVASNLLATYDGTRWGMIDISGGHGLHAVNGLAEGTERIWIGGINAIGYLERNAAGRWEYQSLARELASAGLAPLPEVDHVHAAGAAAFWVSGGRVVRWDGARFEQWNLPSSTGRLRAFPGDDCLYLYQSGAGLLTLGAEGEPELILPDLALPATPVTWVLPPSPDDDSRVPALIGLGNAAYQWRQDGWYERLERISSVLAGGSPDQAVWLSPGRFAIGTLDSGVVVATLGDRVITAITTANGLTDDNVHALFPDGDRLWIGLHNALAGIDGVGVSTFFDRQFGLGVGTPIGIRFHDDVAYVLTTKALLRLEPPSLNPLFETGIRPLMPVFDAPALLWDADSWDGRIWVGGSGGLWSIDDAGAKHVYATPEEILKITVSEKGLVFVDGFRLKALRAASDGQPAVVRDLGATLTGTPVSLMEFQGEIWATTRSEDIQRFTWDERGELRLKAHYREGDGLPADANRTRLVRLGRSLYVFASHEILRLDEDGHAFTPVPELAGFTGIAATPLLNANGSAYWLVQSQDLAELGRYTVLQVTPPEETDGTLDYQPVTVPGIDGVGVATLINQGGAMDRPGLWVGGNRGVMRARLTQLQAPAPPVAPVIRNVRANDHPLLPAAHDGTPVTIGPDLEHLQFAYSAEAAPRAEPVFYQTWVEGIDADWSPASRETRRELGQLGPGRYVFKVRSLDRFGRTSEPVALPFLVQPFWYESKPALVLYALLAGALIFGWRSQALRRQNARLNRLVRERTRELELSNATKSEFLENISHEIRNPLNGLTGLLSLLKEDDLKPRGQDLTRSLRAVAENLRQVFEDVLAFSKVEYGYATLQRQPFLLRPLLEDLLAVFALTAEAQRCPLSLRWPDDLADGFEGDAGKIRTILSNFLANAIKYAPGSPVEIVVMAEAGAAARTTDLFIEVTDLGPGIPLEEQELIFKKFVRGSRARAGRMPGTGLGLATCRLLAQLMHGNVGVHSSPGEGSSFFLGLSLSRARVRAAPADGEPALPAETREKPAALIVDDEPYNQVVLQGIADALGYETDLAADAAQAAARMEKRSYDVVFLDWEMPGAKGDEVARGIRSQSHGHRPLILATTAHDSDEIRSRCLAAGMDGFLLKPYDLARVREVIGALRRPGSVPAAPEAGETAELERAASPCSLAAFEHYGRARPAERGQAVAKYREAIKLECEALRSAITAGCKAEVAAHAHRLRALGGLVRATALNADAARLEAAAKNGGPEDWSRHATGVFAACEALLLNLGQHQPAAASSSQS